MNNGAIIIIFENGSVLVFQYLELHPEKNEIFKQELNRFETVLWNKTNKYSLTFLITTISTT